MTFEEFCQRVKDVVIQMGENPPELRPQSFAVLDDMGNINAPQKGFRYTDKDSPYFYSKVWQDKGFPSDIEAKGAYVLIHQLPSVVNKAFKQSQYEQIEKIQLFVLDSWIETVSNDDSKQKRNTTQIIQDCKNILAELLQKIVRVQSIKNGVLYNSGLPFRIERALSKDNLYGVSITIDLRTRICIL